MSDDTKLIASLFGAAAVALVAAIVILEVQIAADQRTFKKLFRR